MPLHITHPPGF